MTTSNLMAIPLVALVAISSARAVTIDMVTVGNPGNAACSGCASFSGPIGAVSYVYQIGKYEITASQYTEFLNAVAKADPNGLYNPAMADPIGAKGANIQRAGSSPNYVYTVAPDWANRPVNYVSMWDASRFANWLHNGQPTGAQGPGTTESGAYHDIGVDALFGRDAGAKSFIPSVDEWFKAAYHKNNGVPGGYWGYTIASSIQPINTLPDTGNHANFYDYSGTGTNGYTIGSPYYRTNVGEFANSAGFYGTFDQGGNVMEWTDTVFGLSRALYGGSFSSPAMQLSTSAAVGNEPANESSDVGFRVAGLVPEPSSLVLGTLVGVGLLVRRRR